MVRVGTRAGVPRENDEPPQLVHARLINVSETGLIALEMSEGVTVE